jgi:hypothetical protein
MAEFFTAPIAAFLRGWRKARDRHRGVTGASASVAPARAASEDYHKFFGKKWYEMKHEDRVRWTTLGWPEGTEAYGVPAPWDTNDAQWRNKKTFEALSFDQKQAAQALGYTRDSFNDPSSWKGGFISTDTARFETMSWVDIPIRERAHWHMLGWDERAWDTDEDELAPPSSNKYFRELNRAEKEAALALGYTPAAWDAEDV